MMPLVVIERGCPRASRGNLDDEDEGDLPRVWDPRLAKCNLQAAEAGPKV
jgi:hypothetical protein